MPDRLTAEQRSALMARIRSVDTRPELVVRSLLHGLGYRYVLHDKRLSGSPDLVFSSRGAVVFVHGCFWHGHDCGRGFKPKRNAAFWRTKIESNRVRDQRCRHLLRRQGWRVMTVWECATKPPRLSDLTWHLIAFLDA